MSKREITRFIFRFVCHWFDEQDRLSRKRWQKQRERESEWYSAHGKENRKNKNYRLTDWSVSIWTLNLQTANWLSKTTQSIRLFVCIFFFLAICYFVTYGPSFECNKLFVLRQITMTCSLSANTHIFAYVYVILELFENMCGMRVSVVHKV